MSNQNTENTNMESQPNEPPVVMNYEMGTGGLIANNQTNSQPNVGNVFMMDGNSNNVISYESGNLEAIPEISSILPESTNPIVQPTELSQDQLEQAKLASRDLKNLRKHRFDSVIYNGEKDSNLEVGVLIPELVEKAPKPQKAGVLPPPIHLSVSNHELEKMYLKKWNVESKDNEYTKKSSLRLAKNEEAELEDVKEIQCCLNWKTKVDLDCSVLCYDHHGAFKEAVFFKNLKSKDKSIIHFGDQRSLNAKEAQREGDEGINELVYVGLDKIDKNVTCLMFTLNVFSQFYFDKVQECQIRLVYLQKKGLGYVRKNICKFKIGKKKKLKKETGMLMCCVYRRFDGQGNWRVRTIGKPVKGRHVGDEDLYLKIKQYIPKYAVDPKAKFHSFARKCEEKRWDAIRKRLLYRRNWISFTCSGQKLKKMDVFGKSDPYFFITDLTTNRRIVKSSIIMNTLNPVWEEMKLVETKSVMNHPMELSVWDWDKHSKNDLIGKVEFSFSQFFSLGPNPMMANQEEEKRNELEELKCPKMEFLLTKEGSQKKRGFFYFDVMRVVKDGVFKPIGRYQNKVDHYYDPKEQHKRD